MKPEADLVSWYQLRHVGEVPGSSWFCPTGDLTPLQEVTDMNGIVAPDDVRQMVEGREQHLELYQYPEGIHVAKIVDSNDFRVLRDRQAALKYDDFAIFDTAGVSTRLTPVLSDNPLPLPDDHELTAIEYTTNGIVNVVGPSLVGYDDNERLDRMRTKLVVCPEARKLEITTQTPTPHLTNGSIALTIGQHNDQTGARLDIMRRDNLQENGMPYGQITAQLDEAGQIADVSVLRKTAFPELEQADEFNIQGQNWVTVNRPDKRAIVSDVIAHAAGFDHWTGIDLRLTVAGLYRAMGKPNLDVTEVIVPLD